MELPFLFSFVSQLQSGLEQFSGISGWALPLLLFLPLASSRRRLPYLSWYPLRPSPCLRDQKMSLMTANGTNKQKYKLGLPPRCLLGYCKCTHVYHEGCNIYAYDIYGIYGGLRMCQAGWSVLHTHPLGKSYGHLAMSEWALSPGGNWGLDCKATCSPSTAKKW